MKIENNHACFVELWLRLERTRRLLGCQCKRFCIRNVLKSWFGGEANDRMIWEVCTQRTDGVGRTAATLALSPPASGIPARRHSRSTGYRFAQGKA